MYSVHVNVASGITISASIVHVYTCAVYIVFSCQVPMLMHPRWASSLSEGSFKCGAEGLTLISGARDMSRPPPTPPTPTPLYVCMY